MKRNATAVWNGNINDGNGFLTTDSTTLENTPYSWKSRFAEGAGTNPEELMAAAHAGCFTMKSSLDLTTAGYMPEKLETSCSITLDNGTITRSDLTLTAVIPGITEEKFQEIIVGAKKNCPVSKAYNMEITLQAKLIN